MAVPKIDNVRVCVWTKSEFSVTKRQLKEGGFEIEDKGGMLYAYDINKWGQKICILSAIIGFPMKDRVTVRLNETYFSFKNE